MRKNPSLDGLDLILTDLPEVFSEDEPVQIFTKMAWEVIT